jgi:hypothetical protein
VRIFFDSPIDACGLFYRKLSKGAPPGDVANYLCTKLVGFRLAHALPQSEFEMLRFLTSAYWRNPELMKVLLRLEFFRASGSSSLDLGRSSDPSCGPDAHFQK